MFLLQATNIFGNYYNISVSVFFFRTNLSCINETIMFVQGICFIQMAAIKRNFFFSEVKYFPMKLILFYTEKKREFITRLQLNESRFQMFCIPETMRYKNWKTVKKHLIFPRYNIQNTGCFIYYPTLLCSSYITALSIQSIWWMILEPI